MIQSLWVLGCGKEVGSLLEKLEPSWETALFFNSVNKTVMSFGSQMFISISSVRHHTMAALSQHSVSRQRQHETVDALAEGKYRNKIALWKCDRGTGPALQPLPQMPAVWTLSFHNEIYFDFHFYFWSVLFSKRTRAVTLVKLVADPYQQKSAGEFFLVDMIKKKGLKPMAENKPLLF